MLRRSYLSVLSTSLMTPPFLLESPPSPPPTQNTDSPSTAIARVALPDLLPPADLVPETYERTTNEKHTSVSMPRHIDEKVAYDRISRDYSLPVGLDAPLATLHTELRVPYRTNNIPDSVTDADLRDRCHDQAVNTGTHEWSLNNTALNDWFDVETSESIVDGRRQSSVWIRGPETLLPSDGYDGASGQPYQEHASLVRTTDWGVIFVMASRFDEPVAGRQHRLAHRVFDYVRDWSRSTDVSIPENVRTSQLD